MWSRAGTADQSLNTLGQVYHVSHSLKSKPVVSPIVVSYIIPLKEFRRWLMYFPGGSKQRN